VELFLKHEACVNNPVPLACPSGNKKVYAGRYQTKSGKTLEMSDYDFAKNPMFSIADVIKTEK